MLPINHIEKCFYCQSLGGLGNFPTYGKCAFCGNISNPLYLVIYQNRKEYFCCGCTWWQTPRSEKEKEQESK